MVRCVNANSCFQHCIHGAKEPHGKSTMCAGFFCNVRKERVYCIPAKVNHCGASAVDEYLKRLGQE